MKRYVRKIHHSFKKATAHPYVPKVIAPCVLVGIVAAVFWHVSASPPSPFETPKVVTIESGLTLRGAAVQLKEQDAIRSETLFLVLATLLGGEKGLIAGDYFFTKGQNVATIAYRMTSGDYHLEPIKVTIPEGSTAGEIATLLSEKMFSFPKQEFLQLTEGKEGYLFPDTYYFSPTEKPKRIVEAMEDNFYRKTEGIAADIEKSGKSLHEIVTMASLLEEEARTTKSRRMIAGILWRRIDLGMRLQVDAVFPYIIGKNTFQVTRDDLLVESPYNTYLYKGLPLGPISNPGLNSLEAALYPTKSSYLYYLSDSGGGMHYSRTYEEHLRKKNLFLGT